MRCSLPQVQRTSRLDIQPFINSKTVFVGALDLMSTSKLSLYIGAESLGSQSAGRLSKLRGRHHANTPGEPLAASGLAGGCESELEWFRACPGAPQAEGREQVGTRTQQWRW